MSKKKLRPVYMTDEAYKSAQDEADKLGISFSSYMGMCEKKQSNSEIIDVRSKEDLKPTGLIRMANSDVDRLLYKNIGKWAFNKDLNLSDDKIKLIVAKILEETK